jgi:hypothetical protein
MANPRSIEYFVPCLSQIVYPKLLHRPFRNKGHRTGERIRAKTTRDAEFLRKPAIPDLKFRWRMRGQVPGRRHPVRFVPTVAGGNGGCRACGGIGLAGGAPRFDVLICQIRSVSGGLSRTAAAKVSQVRLRFGS